MRFSRFKQQMEGTTSTPRAARPKKPGSKTGSSKGSLKDGLQKTPISPPPSSPNIKREHESGAAYDPGQSPYLKTDPYLQNIPTLEDIPQAEPRTAVERSYMAPQAQFHHLVYPQQSMYPQRRYPQQIQHQRPLPPYRQQFPFAPYNPYHTPMTVAPADLSIHSSPFVPSLNWGEGQSSVQSPWTPVKQDGEDNGRVSSKTVKLEAEQ